MLSFLISIILLFHPLSIKSLLILVTSTASTPADFTT